MKRYIITLVFTCLTVISFSQNVKRSYKTLEKKEYEKAKELFQKNISESPESAAANLGMALILADESGPYFNILDAWEYTVKADNNKNNITQDELEVIGEYFLNTEVRRTSYPVKKKIGFAVEAIESRLIKYIREENDLEAVYELLERYPDFKHYDNVIHIRNQFEFRKYEKQNTLSAYREFITKFPEAAQVKKANRYIDKLAFDEAKKLNTIKAYTDYIAEYPTSDYVQTAIKLRNSAAYNQAKTKNTIDALDAFIKDYPDALEVADAKKIRKELVYKRAKEIKSLEAYNAFILEYPEGKYYIDIFNLKSASLGDKYNAESGLSADMINWSRAFDYKNDTDIASAIAQTIDGGYIVAGETKDPERDFTDAWLVKITATGVLEWNKLVGNQFNDKVTDIFITSQGDIICLGYTQAYENDSLANGWMFKLGPDGKKIWNKNLGNIKMLALAIDAKDQIYMSSVANNLSDTINPNYFIQSFSAEGRKNWERSYVMQGNFNDIDFTFDNKLLLSGDSWVVLLDEKKYVLFDKIFEDGKTIKSGLIDPQQIITTYADDSVSIRYSSVTSTGTVSWKVDVNKTDSTHHLVDMFALNNSIYSFENNSFKNIIRKISQQGNLYPEIEFNCNYELVDAIPTKTGEVVMLLKNNDLVVVCIKP